MGLFDFFRRGDKRSVTGTRHPRDPELVKLFGAYSPTGVHIDHDRSLSIPTYYACIKVLSEDIAKLPLGLYREVFDTRMKMREHDIHYLVSRRPNKWQTPFEFKQLMAAFKLGKGNAYAEIFVDRKTGQPSDLIPLHPDRVTPFLAPNGQRAYAYQPISGPRRIILQDEMWCWMGLSDDGLRGRSVLEDAALTLGLAYSTMEYGATFFANGATPGGVLTHPGVLGDEAMAQLKKDWKETFQGIRNAHKVAVLEEGLKYEKIQLTSEEAQFIESRKISPVEICQFFRMPPHKVGILDKATFSNIEHQGIEYFTDALLSHLISIEETGHRDLLTDKEKRDHYFKFNPDIILRGDIKTRYEAYRIACGRPWMPPNEVRRKEDMDPIDGLDDVYVPLNMDNPGGNPDNTKKDPESEEQ